MPEIRGLSKSFGGVKAAGNISLDFADGSLTAVIGPNGAGKSTFFNLITGALKPDSGQILLNGGELAGRSPPLSARRDPRPCRTGDGIAGLGQQAQPHRGNAVAWRPKAARYRAGA